MTIEQHVKLFNALTAYDKRQAKGKYYNRYALAQYCAALQRTEELCRDGKSLRQALVKCFSGKLLDCLLRAIGETISTREEQRFR